MRRHDSFLDLKADNKAIVKNAVNSVVIQVIFRMKGLITIPVFTYFLLPKVVAVRTSLSDWRLSDRINGLSEERKWKSLDNL